MALSDEEKERRRVARKERDRAYSARYREWHKAEEAGEAEIETAFAPQLAPLEAAEKAAQQAAKAALEAIDKEIAELQMKRTATYENGRAKWHEARARFSEVWNRKREAQNALKKRLDEEFPDLCGRARWSAAVWRPLEKGLANG